jgi:hypothetical protein
MNDSIKAKTISVNKISEPRISDSSQNWMVYTIVIQALLILILLIKIFGKHKDVIKAKFKEESLKAPIDFNNIINSSFNSKELYDSLKIICHPDRFPNDENKRLIAEKIFQELTENQNNINRLKELEEEIKLKLGINF